MTPVLASSHANSIPVRKSGLRYDEITYHCSVGVRTTFREHQIVPKNDIKLYVAAAEIVASAAVVASLVFVVISLNQNTAAIQSANDNFLYQLEDARMADVTSDPDMADLMFRFNSGEALSEVERFRFEYWVLRQVNFWELAFNRHRDGMMPPSQWRAWDGSFRTTVIGRLREETWNRSRSWYGTDFRDHVDAAYAEQ